eukprot:637003-Pyramimonas_sp.AAC.1
MHGKWTCERRQVIRALLPLASRVRASSTGMDRAPIVDHCMQACCHAGQSPAAALCSDWHGSCKPACNGRRLSLIHI